MVSTGTAFFVSWFFFNKNTGRMLAIAGWTTMWLAICYCNIDAIYDDMYPTGPITNLMTALLFTGLVLLGYAFFRYDTEQGHWAAFMGWQFFGIFWIFQIPLPFSTNDTVNLMFLGGALPFFMVLGYHETLNIKWKEQNKGLKFMAGATFITGTIYFTMARIHVVGTWFIWLVALQSSQLANLMFGYNTSLGNETFSVQDGVAIPILGSEISLILACTAIEAIAMFIGALLVLKTEKDPWKKFKRLTGYMKWLRTKTPSYRLWLSFMITVPMIYVLNLLRNALIIHFLNQNTFLGAANSLGVSEFELVHGMLAKLSSFVILIVLALVIFEVLPELHGVIMSLFKLARRDAPEKVLKAREEKKRKEEERFKELEKKYGDKEKARKRLKREMEQKGGKGPEEREDGEDGEDEAGDSETDGAKEGKVKGKKRPNDRDKRQG